MEKGNSCEFTKEHGGRDHLFVGIFGRDMTVARVVGASVGSDGDPVHFTQNRKENDASHVTCRNTCRNGIERSALSPTYSTSFMFMWLDDKGVL